MERGQPEHSHVEMVAPFVRGGGDPRLSFLITARHGAMDIDRCVEALDELANGAKILKRI